VRLYFISFFILFFVYGCFPTIKIPDHTKIEDSFKTLVAETTDIGQQTLYENQNLTHYVVDSVHMYCSELVSMDKEKYRCFIKEGEQLVQGVDPLSFEPSPLVRPIPVKTQ
jgi:hypothetical protein